MATPPTGVGICNRHRRPHSDSTSREKKTPCHARTRRGAAHSIQLAGLAAAAFRKTWAWAAGAAAWRLLQATGLHGDISGECGRGATPGTAPGHFEMVAAASAADAGVVLRQCQIRAAGRRCASGRRPPSVQNVRFAVSLGRSPSHRRIPHRIGHDGYPRRIGRWLVCDDEPPPDQGLSALASPVRPYRSGELKGFLWSFLLDVALFFLSRGRGIQLA